MTMDVQETELPLNLGMATKPSVELQEPSTMRLVENLHWRGQGEIEKRPTNDTGALVAEPTGSAYNEDLASGLVVRGDDVVVVTGKHGLMTYNEALNEAQWARREITSSGTPTSDGGLKYAPTNYEVSRRFIERAQFSAAEYGIFQVASAQYSGVHVIAWLVHGSSSNYMRLKAIDANTGQVVATLEYVAMGDTEHISCCEYTESGKEGVLIAYASTSSLAPYTIKCIRYDHATLSFVADSNLTTNASGNGGVIRFVVTKNGNRFYLAFRDNTTAKLKVQDRTVSTITTTHDAVHDVFSGIDVLVGPTRTLIVSSELGTFYAEVFGTPAASISLAASSESFYGVTAALEARLGSTHDAVVWVNALTSASGPDSSRVRSLEINFSATTAVALVSQSVPHAWCVSRGFTLQDMAHVTFALGLYKEATTTNNAPVSCIVARYRGHSSGTVRHDAVATVCYGRFFIRASSSNLDIFSSTYVDTNDNAWLVLTADLSPGTVNYGGSSVYYPQTLFLQRINAQRPMPMPFASPEPGIVLSAGGVPWEFDGDTPSEASPLMRPLVALDVSAGTGQTGTFSVIAVWRWTDSAGRLKRIASALLSTGAITNKQIDVYVSKCPMAAYDASTAPGLAVDVYITNGTTSSHQLATSSGGDKLSPTSSANGLWYVFSAVDPTPGGTSGSGQTLAIFTTEVAPEPTPAFFYVAKVVDRMVAVDAEDRSRIWFSKPLVAGYGVEWATECTLTINDDCTGVVDMGGGFVVLARGGIYLVDGTGPDALGDGSFSPARKLNTAVDCIDPVSICRTPMGVVFRGRRGFYVLTNGLDVQPFGLPVDPETLTDPALDPSASVSRRMRAVYQEQTNELQIALPSGARLVYNLIEQKWSTYTASIGGAVTVRAARDMAVARGRHWRIDRVSSVADQLASERLFSEVGASYNSDDGGWRIDTPWEKSDGVGGQLRLWRAWLSIVMPSDASDIGSVVVTFYTDYNESAGQSASWSGAELATLYSAGDRVAELPFYPAQQVCKAFKFSIVYTASGSTVGPKPLSLRLRFGTRATKGKRLRAAVKG